MLNFIVRGLIKKMKKVIGGWMDGLIILMMGDFESEVNRNLNLT